MSLRSSAEILGLPTRLPDRERQYVRNPCRFRILRPGPFDSRSEANQNMIAA